MAEVSRAPYIPTTTDRVVPEVPTLLSPHPYRTKAVSYVSPRACRYLSSTPPRPWRAALPAYPLISPYVSQGYGAPLCQPASPYISLYLPGRGAPLCQPALRPVLEGKSYTYLLTYLLTYCARRQVVVHTVMLTATKANTLRIRRPTHIPLTLTLILALILWP